MRYYFYILIFFLFITACRSGATNTSSESGSLALKINNLPIDSCSIRVHHIVTGREVFYQDKFSLVDSLIIPDLEDDVYIIVVSWPKTYISHQVYNNRSFDKELGDDYFELTKPFYFNTRNGTDYVLEVGNDVSLAELEQEGTQILKFKNKGCSECDLADEFWSLYTDFYSRKEKLIDSLKFEYYTSVDDSKVGQSKELYNEMEKTKVSLVNDDLLDKAIIHKVSENKTNPISTFFLFYQLYNYRDFPKFKDAFLSLSGKAKNTKYYKMVEKQYQ